MSTNADDELDARLESLERTLESLSTDLRGRPRGPFGLPRPPSPGELLRFTEEYAIPATIATLEATIKTLEMIRALSRAARGTDATRAGAKELSTEALTQLDRVLDELETTLEEASLPRNTEARSALEQARSLNAEVQRRLDETSGGADGETTGSDETMASSIDSDGDGSESVSIDVDAEIESIREELDTESGRRDQSEGE